MAICKLTPVVFQKITLPWIFPTRDAVVTTARIELCHWGVPLDFLYYLWKKLSQLYSSIHSGKEAVACRDSLPVFASNCISPPHLWTPARKDVFFFLLFCVWTQIVQFPFCCSFIMMKNPSHVFDIVECVMSSADIVSCCILHKIMKGISSPWQKLGLLFWEF